MGFNTDVKHNGVIYHVQTESRQDHTVDTVVYTRGAVIHKCKNSIQDLLGSSDFTEEKLRQRLHDQHAQVIARIRSGEITPAGEPPSVA